MVLIRVLAGAATLICLIGGVVSILFALYYFFAMHAGVRPEKKYIVPFLWPFQLFIPQLWRESGNRARVRFLISVLLFCIFFGAGMMLLKMPVKN
jgi:hypothetical protein